MQLAYTVPAAWLRASSDRSPCCAWRTTSDIPHCTQYWFSRTATELQLSIGILFYQYWAKLHKNWQKYTSTCTYWSVQSTVLALTTRDIPQDCLNKLTEWGVNSFSFMIRSTWARGTWPTEVCKTSYMYMTKQWRKQFEKSFLRHQSREAAAENSRLEPVFAHPTKSQWSTLFLWELYPGEWARRGRGERSWEGAMQMRRPGTKQKYNHPEQTTSSGI